MLVAFVELVALVIVALVMWNLVIAPYLETRSARIKVQDAISVRTEAAADLQAAKLEIEAATLRNEAEKLRTNPPSKEQTENEKPPVGK
jgi:hypothetical protein